MGSARCTTHQSAKPGTASRTRLSSVAAWSSEEASRSLAPARKRARSAAASASACAACAISSRWSRSSVSRLRWVTSSIRPWMRRTRPSSPATGRTMLSIQMSRPSTVAMRYSRRTSRPDARALAQQGEDGVAIVGVDQRVPESRLLQPLADRMAEHRLGPLAHEGDPERGRIGLPHDAVEALDEPGEPRAGLQGAAILPTLIDRGGDATGQPLGGVEIDTRVRLAGGTHQRQGAEDVAASHQRHDHGRADARAR